MIESDNVINSNIFKSGLTLNTHSVTVALVAILSST